MASRAGSAKVLPGKPLTISSAVLRSHVLCWAAAGRCIPIFSRRAFIRRSATRAMTSPSSSHRPWWPRAARRKRSTMRSQRFLKVRRSSRNRRRLRQLIHLCLTNGLQPRRRKASHRQFRRAPDSSVAATRRAEIGGSAQGNVEGTIEGSVQGRKCAEGRWSAEEGSNSSSRDERAAAGSSERARKTAGDSIRDMAERAKAAMMSIASGEKGVDHRKALGQAALARLAAGLRVRRRQTSPAASAASRTRRSAVRRRTIATRRSTIFPRTRCICPTAASSRRIPVLAPSSTIRVRRGSGCAA